MKHWERTIPRTAGLSLGVVALLASILAAAEPQVEYLQHDVSISGREINRWQEQDESVLVVSGNFRLEVGERMIFGDRAVVWLSTRKTSPENRHDLSVYVEGNAEVIDEGGFRTTDELMLVNLHAQGRLELSATNTSTQPLREMPLYQRAQKVREQDIRQREEYREKLLDAGMQVGAESSMRVRRSAGSQVEQPAEVVLDQQREREETFRPVRLEEFSTDQDQPEATAVTSKTPDETKSEVAGNGDEPTLSQTEPAERSPDTQPPAEPPRPVRFVAPGGVDSEPDPEDENRRLTVLRRSEDQPVVIVQGELDSKRALELISNAAVIISRTDLPDIESPEQVPYAPQMMGAEGEKVVGVYLEGDVIMRRGERKITGPRAYYDFYREKAVFLQPTLRTIQEQREIPIVVRAQKMRMISPREMVFDDASISISDFATPGYDIAAKKIYLKDTTPYDEEGEQLAERSYKAKFTHMRQRILGVPFLYLPYGQASFEEGHSAIRKATIGHYGKFGVGVETEWHLFRLLGLVRPRGISATVDMNYYEKGALLGVSGDYLRREENREYAGYFDLNGVYDRQGEDDFGDLRRNINAPSKRGRALLRHKEFLPRDWQIQAELSLLCDRNYLEEFYPDEFWGGKKQENLLYAKKQRDNWALTALMKARLNDFLTQTESMPEVAGYLIGQPLWEDRLTYYGEARLGGKRYREDDELNTAVRSDMMARFDTRHEVNLPLALPTSLGPINIVPYMTGRFTYWSDTPNRDDRARLYNKQNYNVQRNTMLTAGQGDEARNTRFYGQAGVKTNMSFWRVYPNVESRLWDVHKLKHIITPEVVAFTSCDSGIKPEDLYPLDPGVEEIIRGNTGVQFALRQRLQTKRGPEGNRRIVNWMRLDVMLNYFAHNEPNLKGDGRFFYSRPEYSLQRDSLNAEYTWNISDSMALLGDMNYDLGDGQCDRLNLGLAVQRSPRMSYYTGIRYIKELDTAVGTLGVNYKINNKYTLRAFEQYDFTYNGGVNLGSSITIIRKLPRWFISFTFTYDRRYHGEDELTIMLALWPQGVPEARIGGGRLNLLNSSDRN